MQGRTLRFHLRKLRDGDEKTDSLDRLRNRRLLLVAQAGAGGTNPPTPINGPAGEALQAFLPAHSKGREMKRAMLLALATACVAVFALPAMASAGVWHVDKAPLKFSGNGGTATLTPTTGTIVDCSTVAVEGEYETTTTGWVIFTFHNCRAETLFTPACTSPEQPSGTIQTTKLTFHNILLKDNVPGILLTPNHTTNVFAHFSCFGIQTTVEGKGVIGEISNRKCGDKANSAIVKFESISRGHQKHTQITGTGETYDLESTTGGGSAVTASEDAEGTIGFAEEQTLNCTL